MIQWLSPSVLKVAFEASNLDVELRSFALTLWQEPGSRGLSRSNRGGWHSRYLEIHYGNTSVLSELAVRVQEVAMLFLRKWSSPSNRWRGTRANHANWVRFGALWVNVHEAGDYNVEHQHAEIDAVGDEIPTLSGVYYPQGSLGSAKLQLDCREGASTTQVTQPQCSVDADPGTLVIFPATLLHSVEPPDRIVEQTAPRISFAFNLIVRRSASELHLAAMEGNSSRILYLCDRSDVNAKDLEFGGFTPLHHASEAGHLPVLRLLLENRADPFAQSHQLSLPAHLAAEAGHLEVVNELLKSAPNLANKASGSQNRTLMHLAAANGKVDLLQDLLSFQADVELLQADGTNALHASVQNGHLAATEFLVHHFPNPINGRDSAQHQPAHEAARGGQEAILRSLLQASADVTGKGQDSLAYWAAQGGHTAILQLLVMFQAMPSPQPATGKVANTKGEAMANYLAAALIGSGSAPQIKVAELSLVHVAASAGHVEVLSWLQQQQHSMLHPVASSQMQPIHLAASNGHLQVTRLLLEQDINLHCAAMGNLTPLHMAAVNGHQQIAQFLLAMRSSVGSQAADGSQALHVAAASGHLEVAKVL